MRRIFLCIVFWCAALASVGAATWSWTGDAPHLRVRTNARPDGGWTYLEKSHAYTAGGTLLEVQASRDGYTYGPSVFVPAGVRGRSYDLVDATLTFTSSERQPDYDDRGATALAVKGGAVRSLGNNDLTESPWMAEYGAEVAWAGLYRRAGLLFEGGYAPYEEDGSWQDTWYADGLLTLSFPYGRYEAAVGAGPFVWLWRGDGWKDLDATLYGALVMARYTVEVAPRWFAGLEAYGRLFLRGRSYHREEGTWFADEPDQGAIGQFGARILFGYRL